MKSGLFAARIVVFVAFLDLFVQFPVVGPYAKELGASPAFVGLIMGGYSASNILGNLVGGIVLDRWGRRWPLEWGLLATALALTLYVLASSPEQLLAARLVHGLAVAVLTPGAFAIIGDAAAAGQRAKAMGVSGTIIGLTAVLGPPVAGVMQDRVGATAVFLMSATFMVVAAVVFGLLTRQAGAAMGGQAEAGERKRSDFLELLTRSNLLLANFGALALTVGLGTLITHLPITLETQGESASLRGMAFSIFAVVAVIVMAGPTNRLSDRHGRPRVLSWGLAAMATGLGVMGVVAGVPGMAVGMALFGLGFGLLFPAATALVADATSDGGRGQAFGIFYAVYSFGVVIGSVASGGLAEALGELTSVPFLVAAAVAATGAVVMWLASTRAQPVPSVDAT